MKREKVKNELIRLQWHGGKIKYAGHYFRHEKTRYETQSVLGIK